MCSSSKKKLLVLKYETERKKQQGQLQSFLDPQRKVALASFKLAYIIGQNKKPLSDCEHILEFAKAVDPDSDVFKQMAGSRSTITRRLVDIHGFLKRELREEIDKAIFWSYMLDESTDKGVTEEVILYARFVDISKGEVVTKFLAVAPLEGHPDAANIFSAVCKVFGPTGFDLPCSQIVSQTSDGASTLLSTLRSVAAKAVAEFNPKLFVQHCFNHRLVLAGKDGQQHIPNEVEVMIKDVLNHFKYSAVSQSQFKTIMDLSEDKFIKLISYHKIRWLSLNECVQRLVQLHTVLCTYLENESQDMSNRAVVRRKCVDLKERLQNPQNLLYLFFLKAYLPLLSQINVQCQKRNSMIYEVYSKIRTVVVTLLEPVVKDTSLPAEERLSSSNIIEVNPDTYGNDGELRVLGREFNEYWRQVQDNADLTILEQRQVLKNCQAYIIQVAKSLEQRFPEANFIITTCSFLFPPRRKHQIISIQAVLERFDNKFFDFNAEERGYHSYRNVDLLDYLYEEKYHEQHSSSGGESGGNVVGFRCDLYQNFPDYRELAKLAILLMTITPDTCECERGFSVMNYVKNELRTAMTETTLNACMAVGLEKRSLNQFPFVKLL